MHLLFNNKLYTNIEERYPVIDHSEDCIYLINNMENSSGVALYPVKHPGTARFVEESGKDIIKDITLHLFNYILQQFIGKAFDKNSGKVVTLNVSNIINLDAVISHLQYTDKLGENKDDEQTTEPNTINGSGIVPSPENAEGGLE